MLHFQSRPKDPRQSITLNALQYDEDERPTAAEIHQQFEELRKEMQFWMKEVSGNYCTIS